MQEILTRRQVLRAAGAVGLSVTTGGLLVAQTEKAPLRITPSQTPGPFYPQPAIKDQKFHDTDLVRKMDKDVAAMGEEIKIDGVIRDVTGKPVENAVVEIWQACASGRYNHARDNNPAKLDDKFQYWGVGKTGEDGWYSFRTIRPGEYPGRTSHVHCRVLAPGFRGVVTQMYFADRGARNARDFIYNSLSKPDRNAVTVEFAKATDAKVPNGTFDLVLAAK